MVAILSILEIRNLYSGPLWAVAWWSLMAVAALLAGGALLKLIIYWRVLTPAERWRLIGVFFII